MKLSTAGLGLDRAELKAQGAEDWTQVKNLGSLLPLH